MGRIIIGDCLTELRKLPSGSVHCCVTSPPYWGLRSYLPKDHPDKPAELGQERTPEEYVAHLVEVFREVRRVLRDDGTLWLNIADSYSNGGRTTRGADPRHIGRIDMDFRPDDGLKPKDLCMIPARVAIALQSDGWYLRSDIIWAKSNPMPENVTDRPAKSYEHIFLLAKSERYYYDAEAVKEPIAESTIGRGPVTFGGAKGRAYEPTPDDPNFRNGTDQWGRVYEYKDGKRNRRDVWTIATEPSSIPHYAMMPTRLVEPCIFSGTSERGCCPECGAPWERVVCRKTMKIKRTEWGEKAGPRTAPSGTMEEPAECKTLGWRPTCSHYDDRYRSEKPRSRNARHRYQQDAAGRWFPRARKRPGGAWPIVESIVLDPFFGAGTVGLVALRHRRDFIGIELDARMRPYIEARMAEVQANLLDVAR